MASFYSMNGVEWAQVQAVGVSVQIGDRIWGVSPSAWMRNHDGWGPFALQIMAHDWNCGMRTIFGLRLLRFKMTWKSKGDTVPGHYRYDERGLTFKWFSSSRRRISA